MLDLVELAIGIHLRGCTFPLGQKRHGPRSGFTDTSVCLHQLLMYQTLKMGLTVASARGSFHMG